MMGDLGCVGTSLLAGSRYGERPGKPMLSLRMNLMPTLNGCVCWINCYICGLCFAVVILSCGFERLVTKLERPSNLPIRTKQGKADSSHRFLAESISCCLGAPCSRSCFGLNLCEGGGVGFFLVGGGGVLTSSGSGVLSGCCEDAKVHPLSAAHTHTHTCRMVTRRRSYSNAAAGYIESPQGFAKRLLFTGPRPRTKHSMLWFLKLAVGEAMRF